MTESWILEALRLTEGEPADSVFWHHREGSLKLYFLCNDVFAWGCADAEEITEANLRLLAQARADLVASGDKYADHLGDLYAARVRKLRPQGACYPYYPESIWKLFDACGPEREVGMGNPKPRPEEAK
ncbi:hypothetical protein KIH74_22600 [Kineosporia sp. J2-2]|uniref:Uncharacterized protein n=1 Tax=Kineosporia corallincola TaxID=2835133 RepID=A0ABS5TNW4_9ACTN|nr:hypothetical protein [Kineosporia corallincola]MBT0771748.1 hypothetical protein [Kineosporia corallincola]